MVLSGKGDGGGPVQWGVGPDQGLVVLSGGVEGVLRSMTRSPSVTPQCDRMTGACENITFDSLYYAGGNETIRTPGHSWRPPQIRQ